MAEADVEVLPPPATARGAFNDLLTPQCVAYVAALCRRFSLDPKCDSDAYRAFIRQRNERQARFDRGELPEFLHTGNATAVRRGDWAVPAHDCPRMSERKVEVGDLDPSRHEQLMSSLYADEVSGVQCDFDDGFCPSWGNVLVGLRNLVEASHLYGERGQRSPASIVFRPRAWNMVELNFRVGGRAVPGPLFDLGV